MPGTNVPGQRVRGALGREGHGSAYKGHKGIGLVCRVGVCYQGHRQGCGGPGEGRKDAGYKSSLPKGYKCTRRYKVPFPTGIFVPVKKTFLSLHLKIKFEKLTHFLPFQAFPASLSQIGQKKSYCH
jgi:hypothetical protein